ncbi:NAD-dependent epimerase/dehydratase family protein [uncultured Ruegeria sp.]|uniref:NAD-dependent epimerase/dehydratase family protein n=1 Tax=uncultured Ruegeria sp. TaxID=259304 RepID=UPI002630EFB4|nr:NAD-dependent epimerase/dehydratase family protein [uncultured Ruegeria sp.]
MTTKSLALVTGSLGLVGAAAVRRFATLGFEVIGIDNDMRRVLFGDAASNAGKQSVLAADCPGYVHHNLDIRDNDAIHALFRQIGQDLAVVVHAAAQPSHDWAAGDPTTDFTINATATLNLLEACRSFAPSAAFLFTSTNKVYGARPNLLPLQEHASRLEPSPDHPYYLHGIDETMSIDQTQHSLFGVSKVAADLMVQEYATRFGLKAAVFRAGCLTGEDHSGAKAHGFLSYLCRTALRGDIYEVIGNGGKQVRDNLHADDLAEAFVRVVLGDKQLGVYNIGGGRNSSVSVIEALDIAQNLLGREVTRQNNPDPRYGDHQWWISDTRAFQADYPGWAPRYSARDLIARMLGQ